MVNKLSRDKIWEKKQEKKLDLYYNRVWVDNLCKEVTKMGSGISALIYKELGMILFIWNRIIFYKVMMDAQNELTPIEVHIKKAKRVLRALKEGKLQYHAVEQSQEQFKNLDTSNAQKR